MLKLFLVLPCLMGICVAQDAVKKQASSSRPSTAETKPQSREPKSQAKPKMKLRRGGYLGLFMNEKMESGQRLVLIESVMKGSEASELGFKKGDRVLKVNGRRVPHGDAFIGMLWGTAKIVQGRRRPSASKARRPLPKNRILVERDGKEVTIEAGLDDLDVRPKVGQVAPDFELSYQDSKKRFRLHASAGKRPMLLIFGSFT